MCQLLLKCDVGVQLLLPYLYLGKEQFFPLEVSNKPEVWFLIQASKYNHHCLPIIS